MIAAARIFMVFEVLCFKVTPKDIMMMKICDEKNVNSTLVVKFSREVKSFGLGDLDIAGYDVNCLVPHA